MGGGWGLASYRDTGGKNEKWFWECGSLAHLALNKKKPGVFELFILLFGGRGGSKNHDHSYRPCLRSRGSRCAALVALMPHGTIINCSHKKKLHLEHPRRKYVGAAG